MAKRSPRTAGGSARRVPVSTKILPDLRDQLEAAATEGGRTLGNEIERRLERSLKFNQELLALFEDYRTFNAFVAIALAWKDLETATGKKWYDSADSIIAARASAAGMLEMMRSSDGSSAYRRLADISDDRRDNLHSLGFLSSDRIRDYAKNRPFDGDAAAESLELAEDLFGTPTEKI